MVGTEDTLPREIKREGTFQGKRRLYWNYQIHLFFPALQVVTFDQEE